MALRRAVSEGIVLLCHDVLAELQDVLERQKFRRYVREETIANFLLALSDDGFLIEVDVEITAFRDPKDDKSLSLAMSGGATHIVTGD